jgi:aspartokinase/homoserine dehydrogenase 1
VVGVSDRSGYVFDPEGISTRRLDAIAREKRNGHSLRRLEGGRSGSAEEAVEAVSRHALSHPVLVDVTADDTGPALRAALTHGMELVLANKRPLASSTDDVDKLFALARSQGRRVRYEATVGAGLPVMDTLAKLVETGDSIVRIDGCVSGTLGFLLSGMERGRPFSEILREAVAKGYSEPDPRDDLSGADVARKALILGRLIGFRGEPRAVGVESLVPPAARSMELKSFIARLENWDAEWQQRIAAARSRDQVLRYVASVSPERIRVALTPVPREGPFGSLQGTDNQIVFTTARYTDHPLVIRGPGAGPVVTAAGVLNDVLALARRSR